MTRLHAALVFLITLTATRPSPPGAKNEPATANAAC
jgi:hypothetical protein